MIWGIALLGILRTPYMCCGAIRPPVARRLLQHNQTSAVGWTARHRPWTLVYTEKFDNYRAALKRGVELKARRPGDKNVAEAFLKFRQAVFLT